MWKNLKDHTKTLKGGTPQSIINEGITINKPSSIAELANKFCWQD